MCLVKALTSAMGLYSSRLQVCQKHLKDSTQLLQVGEGRNRSLLLYAPDLVFRIATRSRVYVQVKDDALPNASVFCFGD